MGISPTRSTWITAKKIQLLAILKIPKSPNKLHCKYLEIWRNLLPSVMEYWILQKLINIFLYSMFPLLETESIRVNVKKSRNFQRRPKPVEMIPSHADGGSDEQCFYLEWTVLLSWITPSPIHEEQEIRILISCLQQVAFLLQIIY